MKVIPTSIDEYLAGLLPAQRDALEAVRRAIHAAAPTAEECISYGLPTFRVNGKAVFSIGAAARHCALYGASGDGYEAELAGYDLSGKGTIRFQPDKPLPDALVGRLVRDRIAANAARPGRRTPAAKAAALKPN